MCRMLGMVSVSGDGAAEAAPLPSWYHLVGAAHSLRVQAGAGCVLGDDTPGHADSWGVGWFDAQGRPSLLRQTGSAEDSAYYVLGAEQASRGEGAARTLIGHLRKASCGAVTSENAHPVRADYRRGVRNPITPYESLLLAHNGTLRDALTDTLRPEMEGRPEARSDSDTVTLAGWLAARLAASDAPFFDALTDALRELLSRAGAVAPGGDLTKAYTGLNLLIARPEGLYALRQFSKNPEYYTLLARPLTPDESPGGGWIVASEPTDDARNWEPLTPGALSFYSVVTAEVEAREVG
jgi:predicted glutamine amidotransferase